MKLAHGVCPCGCFIPHFDQISVKISVLGSYTLIVAPMGVKFVKEDLLRAEFNPIGAIRLPCGFKGRCHGNQFWDLCRNAIRWIRSSGHFYSACNARIASAVLATAIPSVHLSVCHTPVLCQNDGT